MNPYLLLGAGLAFVASVTGAFFYGQQVGQDSIEAQQARDNRIAQVAYESSQKATAEAIAAMEIKNVEITQPIRTEIRTRTVYAECKHTPDGLRALNNAITGRTEPLGDSKLPRTDAPAAGR